MAYRLALDQAYAGAESYRGPAEQGVAEFKGPPEQLAPANMVARIAQILVDMTHANDAVPLRMRIWADTSPVLWTNYKIEYVLHASPFPWLIFIGVLVGLGLIALTAWQMSDIEWGAVVAPIASTAWAGVALLVLLVVMAAAGRKKEA